MTRYCEDLENITKSHENQRSDILLNEIIINKKKFLNFLLFLLERQPKVQMTEKIFQINQIIRKREKRKSCGMTTNVKSNTDM